MEGNEIKIGYRLHPDYWNRGLASEAAQVVRDHAYRDLNPTEGHFADPP
jgi:RimJ/RimL family protein N-acetyltransferase